MAERISEQVPKGSRVCIQGKLNPSSWVNREGVKQTRLRVLSFASGLVCHSCAVTITACTLQLESSSHRRLFHIMTQMQITANEVRFVERDGGVPAMSAGQAGWGAQQPQQQQVTHQPAQLQLLLC